MRIRLTVWSVVAALLIVAGGLASTYFLVGRQLENRLQQELSAELARYEEFLGPVDGPDAVVSLTRDYLEGPASASLRRRGMIFALVLSNGATLSNSDEVTLEGFAPTRRLLEGEAVSEAVEQQGDDLLLAGRPVYVDGALVGAAEVAGPLTNVREAQEQVLDVLVLAGAVVIALVGLGAWVLVGRALTPVRRMAETASDITRRDLSRRIEYQGPRDEVDSLAVTLNGMLDRLEGAFAAQDRFISDVSHELRTPLTVVKGHLQVLDEGPPVPWEEVRHEHGVVLEQIDRLNRMVGELLALARLQRADLIEWSEFDLGEFMRTLADQGRHLAERDWRLEDAPAVRITADKDKLTQALLNLMQNAVRHTSEGGAISLGAWVGPQEIGLSVTDAGSGMPEHVRQFVTERFYRGSDDDPRGLGLGLAIVKGITEAHGGRVEIDSAPGRGTRVTLVLPRVSGRERLESH